MLILVTTQKNRIVSAMLSFILLTAILSIIWHLFIQLVLMQISSLPPATRHGYDNPYLSILGITVVFLGTGYLLYGLLTSVLPKTATSILPRIVIGIITGLLPVIILQLTTFGLPLSDPAIQTQLAILALGGLLFPITQNAIIRYLVHKQPFKQFFKS